MGKNKYDKVQEVEEVEEVEDEVEATEEVVEESAPKLASFQNMTADERALASRIMAENKDWQTIDPQATVDYSLAEDPFKLPKPAKDLRDKKLFAFRWIRRTPERLDEVKNAQEILRWWPVNRMQPVAGAFDDYVDGTTGAVHLLDQMLVFKPWWLYERHQEYKARLANTRDDITTKDGQEINDLRMAAARRRDGRPKTRTEISGNDILFRGEAEVDQELGTSLGSVSDSDLAVNE